MGLICLPASSRSFHSADSTMVGRWTIRMRVGHLAQRFDFSLELYEAQKLELTSELE
jgi:hypothetical protein